MACLESTSEVTSEFVAKHDLNWGGPALQLTLLATELHISSIV